MTTVFLVCAVVGGTVLVLQFAMTLIGMGGESLDIDLPGDMDADLDFDVDVDTDFQVDTDAASDAGGHVDSSWLFGVISFRTVVAALAFFGLAGLAAQAAGAETLPTLGIALAAGVAAMYAVYWMVQSIRKLKAEGTPRVQRAVGRHGTVYTTIPAEQSGTGKIQLSLQNRTMEYLALTPGEALSPGAKIVVTDVITSNTVEVEPVLEPHNNNDG